jgi:hypothetical protein
MSRLKFDDHFRSWTVFDLTVAPQAFAIFAISRNFEVKPA